MWPCVLIIITTFYVGGNVSGNGKVITSMEFTNSDRCKVAENALNGVEEVKAFCFSK